MNELYTIQLETDYRKWLAFSPSAGSNELIVTLKKALKSRRSKGNIVIAKEKHEGRNTYHISEKGNSTTLQVSEDEYPEFFNYFSIHYLGEFDKEAKVFVQNEQVSSLKPKVENHNESDSNPPLFDDKQEGPGLSLLRRISSANKLRHAFHFSLLCLAIQQIYIIPANFGDLNLVNTGNYSMLIVMLLVWWASVWAYVKLFPFTNSYKENLKLTYNYFALWWFLGFTEVIIITWIRGDFNLWFSVFIMFLGQFIAAIMGLFLTVIAYYIQGGKVVRVD